MQYLRWTPLEPRTTAQDVPTTSLYTLLGPNPVSLINACFILVTLGQIALNFLLGTLLFSKSVRRRNATLINLLVVTVFQTMPPGLLYYAGHILDPQPPPSLCMVQTVLNYGTDPMFIVASLALVLEVLMDTALLRSPFRDRRVQMRLLVALPYLIFAVFVIWTTVLGVTHKSAVKHQPNNLYCSLTYESFGRGVNILSAAIVIFTISLEIYVLVKVKLQTRILSAFAMPSTIGRAFILRILAFTSLQSFYFVWLGLNFFLNNVVTHIVPIVYEALMPLATFVIFASTEDCIAVWKSWFTGPWRSVATVPENEKDTTSKQSEQSSIPISRNGAGNTDQGSTPTLIVMDLV